MKRRYLAMVLGLVLAIAPANVFAEESSDVAVEVTTEPANEAGDGAEYSEEVIAIEEMDENGEPEELKEQLWGSVTAVDEASITIAVGTLGGDEMPGAGPENGEMPEAPVDGSGAEAAGEESADGSDVTDEESADGSDMADEESADGTDAADEESADGSDVMDEENAAPEQMSAYDALELTGEEMTIAITEDTEVYFVYGDTDIVGLKMTARDFAGENGEFLLEMQAEDAGEVTDAEVNAAEDAEVIAEEDAEATDVEAIAEEDAEATDVEAIAEEGVEAADAEAFAEDAKLSAGEMNKMHTLEIESAAAESIIADDLVNITLDEDGNAAVILIVMPQNEA